MSEPTTTVADQAPDLAVEPDSVGSSVTVEPIDASKPPPAADADRGPRDHGPRWAWPVAVLIATLGGVAFAWDITHDGLHYYYAAAANTMASSWHAFFFASFDMRGIMTVDKLPGALWVQALVIRIFGVSTASLVAPAVAAGIGAILAAFVATRRVAGPRTGLAAAALLAATPAMSVVTRGDTSDSWCVLLLTLAAGAATAAIKSGRLRPLLVAAVFVGLAFQTKMLEAWAILPGLALAYLIATPGSRRRRARHLAVAGIVTLVVSLAWMAAISLVPAADRPYVDGSRDNSIFEQVFVYNGVERFSSSPFYGMADDSHLSSTALARYQAATRDNLGETPTSPGWSRLIEGYTGRDVGWLMPAALLALIAGLLARRRKPRTDLIRAGLILWGAWFLIYAVALSASAVVLSYYTSMLAPPTAVLCALGAKMMWRSRLRARLKLAIAVASTALAVGGEWNVVRDAPSWTATVVLGCGVIVIGSAAAAAVISRRDVRTRRALGFATITLLLAAPAAATVSFVHDRGGEWDYPLAERGTLAQFVVHAAEHTQPGSAHPGYGGVIVPTTSAASWNSFRASRNYLDTHGETLIFASSEASAYVLTGSANVVPFGGYTGYIPVLSVDDIRARLDRGEMAYAIVPGSQDIRADDQRVLLIKSKCLLVSSKSLEAGAGPVVYWCGRNLF